MVAKQVIFVRRFGISACRSMQFITSFRLLRVMNEQSMCSVWL